MNIHNTVEVELASDNEGKMLVPMDSIIWIKEATSTYQSHTMVMAVKGLSLYLEGGELPRHVPIPEIEFLYLTGSIDAFKFLGKIKGKATE